MKIRVNIDRIRQICYNNCKKIFEEGIEQVIKSQEAAEAAEVAEMVEMARLQATVESVGGNATGGLAGGEFFPVYIIFDSTCMCGDSLIKIELGGYRYPAVLVYWNRPDGTRRYFLEIRDLSLRRDDFEEGQSLAIQKQ